MKDNSFLFSLSSRLAVYAVMLVLVFNANNPANAFVPTDILKRFEYKLSFKGPHMVFKDDTIPFWEHSGSAIASNDQVRLTPSLRSQKGRIWAKTQISSSDWEIEVQLRISGRGRVGADGMAIWYTDKIGVDGPVFGSNDYWNGLGIFLDSFDNDGQQNNPYILAMVNDGTKAYDHDRDGISQQIGGCMRDFRNKPFPIRLKIEYYKRALTINYHAGLTNDLTNYEICTRIENIDLPRNGHFGVSAATGGLADDQDVLSFITHSLIDRNTPEASTPSTEEQKRLDKEYEDFMRQLESEKEKYNKEHPEIQKQYDEKRFEGEYDRQFNMILDVQNSIHQSMRLLDSKLAEILGRQERIVTMISASTGQQALPPQQGGGVPMGQGQQQMPQVDSIRRDEVNHIINQQNDLVRNMRDISSSILDMHRKTNFIHDVSQQQRQNPIGSQQQAGVFQDNGAALHQINDNFKTFKSEMAMLLSRQQGAKCPDMPSCLSATYLIIVILAQTIILIGYYTYKNRSESQMKKFY